jgi:hypothetical protein
MRLLGIDTWKPFACGISKFEQLLQLKMVLKVILTFLGPADLMFVMLTKLIEKNLATLMGCQFGTRVFILVEALGENYYRAIIIRFKGTK